MEITHKKTQPIIAAAHYPRREEVLSICHCRSPLLAHQTIIKIMSAEEAETKVPEKEEGAAGEEEEETVKEEESNAHFEPLVSCFSTCALVACGTSHCCLPPYSSAASRCLVIRSTHRIPFSFIHRFDWKKWR